MQYLQDNKKLPDTLSQLVPAYIENIPLDPFNDRGNSYIYTPAENTFQIYSFGPDSKSDFGLISYNLEKGPVSDGDIIIQEAVE